MAKIKAFKCIRPAGIVADKVAALPYDVYNRQEAKEAVKDNPLSFLNIDRAETGLDDSISTYDDSVYERARTLLVNMMQDGTFITEPAPCLYIYELTMEGRSQSGLVCCASVDDYLNNVIKKHENTREEKELDRINHVDRTNAQTGPIFLAYRAVAAVDEAVSRAQESAPLYDFVSDDGIGHRVWRIADEETLSLIIGEFAKINEIYIADGHHRAASAIKVALKRREQAAGDSAEHEYDYFLSVMFPDNQLKILPYNRVLKDLNGLAPEALIKKIEEAGFEVAEFSASEEDIAANKCSGYLPNQKATFGMYLDKKWYKLAAGSRLLESVKDDPVKALDVSILQESILAPVLSIGDPRTDSRIDFVGGIRGIKELERRCEQDCALAFSMYPTSMAELFAVSDAGLLMPPKSTWFEPKLRSGLFIHSLS